MKQDRQPGNEEEIENLVRQVEILTLLNEAAFEALVLHRQGRILDVNSAFIRMFGYSREEALDMPVEELASPAWRQKVIDSVKSGTEEPYEAEGLRKDGGNFWGRIRGRNITWRGERARVTSVYDVTERWKAQLELQESEEKFRSLAEQSPNMIFINCLGRTVYVNQRGAELTGYSREDLLQPDFDFRRLISPESLELVEQAFARHLRAEEVPPYEYALLSKDGRRMQCINNTRLIKFEGRPAIMGVVTDISHIKRMESERQLMQQQIQHAQKLESMGLLAGGIAHDFNNLLMGVLGNASLALAELPEGTSLYQTVLKIEAAAVRAAELTNQMLAYSGKGRFVVRPLDLSALVREMSELLRVSIGKNVTLRLDLAQKLEAVEADATQMRQVVMNLLTNASDAIGDGPGLVTVYTGVTQVDRQYLASTYISENLPEGKYVVLEVSDTGGGMDAETMARVFDPFFTTKFTGRGLGMAAVLGIVRGHRGTIKIYSEPGKGTTVKVLLPVASGDEAAMADISPAPKTVSLDMRGRCVLVVDDDETVREVTRAMLESLGAEVICAGDGEQALVAFAREQEKICLVILDTTMPRLGGEETFQRLRQISSTVRVLLTSGYNEQDVTNRFAGRRLAGFLQKPFHIGQLALALQKILEAGAGKAG